MDISKILADLRKERDQLEEAILAIERLAYGRGKRRGRPPSWMVEAKTQLSVGTRKRSNGQKTTSAAA